MVETTQKADDGGASSSPSQEFVLPQVHSLDDVPAVIKHPPDILRVHGTGEVGVAVVSAIAARSADPLREETGGRGQVRSHTTNIWYMIWMDTLIRKGKDPNQSMQCTYCISIEIYISENKWASSEYIYIQHNFVVVVVLTRFKELHAQSHVVCMYL